MQSKLIYIWMNKDSISDFYKAELSLYKAGYEIKIFDKGNELHREMQEGCSALIVEFDTLVAHKTDIIKSIRKQFEVPLLAYFKSYAPDKIESGLLAGFDDFLVEDYTVELIQMKLMDVLKRNRRIAADRMAYYQNLKVDEIGNVYCDGREMGLSRHEAEVLLLMILAHGNRVSKAEFLERIWPGNDTEKPIRDTILRLRKKMRLFDAKCEIISLNNWGYMLEAINWEMC